ncbi:hypothetical protein PCL_03575 [Purpureocillium lilacinum]|uniref:Uncharacterized protein n=1 Tax=Purpureocillium lilacinum TaxID=33203 RepID=A0A2U3EPG0_PURLI|nr:hypothetical protein PCL_03575 [Purpureocillium lilacinum]
MHRQTSSVADFGGAADQSQTHELESRGWDCTERRYVVRHQGTIRTAHYFYGRSIWQSGPFATPFMLRPPTHALAVASTTTLFRRSIPPVAGMGWDAHKDGGGWARPRSHGNGQSQTHTDDMATCDGPLGLLFLGRAMNAPSQYGLHRGLLCVASRLLMLGRIRFGVFHRQGDMGSVHEENVTSRPGMTAGCAATDDHQPDNHGDPTSSLEPSPRHGS